jgi:hypothetical protein
MATGPLQFAASKLETFKGRNILLLVMMGLQSSINSSVQSIPHQSTPHFWH